RRCGAEWRERTYISDSKFQGEVINQRRDPSRVQLFVLSRGNERSFVIVDATTLDELNLPLLQHRRGDLSPGKAEQTPENRMRRIDDIKNQTILRHARIGLAGVLVVH